MYRVRCVIHTAQNILHLSNVYSGICALASDGLVRVDFESPSSGSSHALDPVVLWTEVSDTQTGEERRIVFDMYDRSDVFVRDSLKLCDVYFKRSYYAPDVEGLEPDLERKVLPFGLNYPCRTAESTWRILSRILPGSAWAMLQSPLGALREIWRADLYAFLNSPPVSAFAQPPDHPVERSVHFQSRIWEDWQLGPDCAEEVNRPRIELTRLLKQEFGASFQGGIVPSRYSRQQCPRDLSQEPKQRSIYVTRSKPLMIGIHTRGLHHSIGFKLAEYLASSKCIVTEPLRNELPTPLVANQNYLEYSSPQECIERCRQILRDDHLASRMRKNNWEYYQKEVRPDRHIANCLERAFGRNAPVAATAQATRFGAKAARTRVIESPAVPGEI